MKQKKNYYISVLSTIVLLIFTLLSCGDPTSSLLVFNLKITNDGNGTTNPTSTVEVNNGKPLKITATPGTGYTFSAWDVVSGSGVVFSDENSASTSVTLTENDATIIARFSSVGYILTITTLGNGTTDPSGSIPVNHNEPVDISATADTGWIFNVWESVSGTGVSFGEATEAETTVTLTAGNATIRARFIDEDAPSGYSVVIDQSYIDENNETALSFTYSGVAIEDWGDYHYSIDDTNAGTVAVTGSGPVTAASAQITGINISSLDEGTLTIAFYIVDPEENTGGNVYDTVLKDTVAPSFEDINDAGDGNYKDDEYITFDVNMEETGLTLRANLYDLDSAFSSTQALTDDGDGTYSYTTEVPLNKDTMAEGLAIPVEFTATDSVGHITINDSLLTLELDKSPPIGSFIITVDYTQSVSVTLDVSGIIGAKYMRFGNSEGTGGWGDYDIDPVSWTLESTSDVGIRTVYGEFRDAAGNIYPTSDDTLFVKKLTASVGATNDLFGCSVASSSDGSTVIGGASGDNSSQGAAYAYYGTLWGSEKIFTDTVYGGAGDFYGDSVGISGSGSVIAIGAWGDNSFAGHVWIRSGTNWGGTPVRLTLGAANDYFGKCVAVSGNASVVVAGAYGDDDVASAAGAAYVNYGTSWATNKILTASDGAASDWFGSSVAVSEDGSVVVVGAVQDDDKGNNSGSVYVYSGSNWVTQTKLIASDGLASDKFGFSVAVSADGKVVVVGAYNDDNGSPVVETDSGSVYVYSGSNWGTEKKIIASDYIEQDYFGCSVGVSENGSIVVVGANGDDDNGDASGSVYVYSGSNWATETKLTAFDGEANDSFGTSVSISSDGSTVVIGASGDDSSVGAVYLLAPVEVSW